MKQSFHRPFFFEIINLYARILHGHTRIHLQSPKTRQTANTISEINKKNKKHNANQTPNLGTDRYATFQPKSNICTNTQQTLFADNRYAQNVYWRDTNTIKTTTTTTITNSTSLACGLMESFYFPPYCFTVEKVRLFNVLCMRRLLHYRRSCWSCPIFH